jgi:hypothetical protein
MDYIDEGTEYLDEFLIGLAIIAVFVFDAPEIGVMLFLAGLIVRKFNGEM